MKILDLIYTLILPHPPFKIPPSGSDPIYRIGDERRDSIASWNSIASLATQDGLASTSGCRRCPSVSEFGVRYRVNVSPMSKRSRLSSNASETSYGKIIPRSHSTPVDSDSCSRWPRKSTSITSFTRGLRRRSSERELHSISNSSSPTSLSLPHISGRRSMEQDSESFKTMPVRRSHSLSGTSFDLDLSPIIEDIGAFPDWQGFDFSESMGSLNLADLEQTCSVKSVQRGEKRQSLIPSVVLTLPTPELGSSNWMIDVAQDDLPDFSLPEEKTGVPDSDAGRKPCRRCMRSGSLCACEASLEVDELDVGESKPPGGKGVKAVIMSISKKLLKGRRRISGIF